MTILSLIGIKMMLTNEKNLLICKITNFYNLILIYFLETNQILMQEPDQKVIPLLDLVVNFQEVALDLIQKNVERISEEKDLCQWNVVEVVQAQFM